MALSDREKQILDSIAKDLAEADPSLPKIAATTPEEVTRKHRKLALAFIICGVLLVLMIAFKWWLAPIGAISLFVGLYLLFKSAKLPAPGKHRNRSDSLGR